ncbi:cyclin-domain fused to serine-threonine kinase [Acanthamoeba polyphaga moumouvirus]|uniref:Cyclin-domain fused to serine-threonine kinase n=1 Tax=Acanthamoeba polyphaga moumouvirus TaxID=1269028 RepID=L7RCF3_9VIRU|nr:cyclin-domain fused to serine-threonine kinase [Acanthamoeba polyphaga moumouvirus]AGC02269.1 cyclin-domain fused to serine-threonine kinase [Acanthamoeba polyphaga moumouvirus]
MYQNKNLSKKRRHEVLDWLLKIIHSKKFKNETLHHGIIIMNRYLYKSEVDIDNIYLVGLLSLNLALKIHEVSSMEIEEVVSLYNEYFYFKMRNESFVRQIEKDILETLDYELYNDNAWQYVKLLSGEERIIEQQFNFTYYLSNIIMSSRYYGFIDNKELAEKIILLTKNIYSLDRIYLTNDSIMKLIYKCYKKEIENNILPEIRFIFKEMNMYDFIKNKFYDIVCNIHYKIKPKLKLCKQNDICWYTKKDISERQVISSLGEGTYGKVEQVFINNNAVALKIMYDREECTGIGSLVLRELNTLRKLNHSNINKINGFYYDYDNHKAYFGLELMEKSLFDYLKERVISNTRKDLYILQLLRGLKYIHDNKIMHRDLSPSNILVSNDHLQISDFGMSKYYVDSNLIKTQTDIIFSIYYRPIEIYLGKKYTEKADIWACACVIGFILTERHIFEGETESEIINCIFKRLGTPTIEHNSEIMTWPKFSEDYLVHMKSGFVEIEQKYPQYAKILYSMLEMNPINRPSISQILDQFESIIKN